MARAKLTVGQIMQAMDRIASQTDEQCSTTSFLSAKKGTVVLFKMREGATSAYDNVYRTVEFEVKGKVLHMNGKTYPIFTS